MDGNLKGTTSLDQSEPGSNDNVGVLHTHQISGTDGIYFISKALESNKKYFRLRSF